MITSPLLRNKQTDGPAHRDLVSICNGKQPGYQGEKKEHPTEKKKRIPSKKMIKLKQSQVILGMLWHLANPERNEERESYQYASKIEVAQLH